MLGALQAKLTGEHRLAQVGGGVGKPVGLGFGKTLCRMLSLDHWLPVFWLRVLRPGRQALFQ
ncbi:hypothetical protein D3C77_633550 [compost metagenome]